MPRRLLPWLIAGAACVGVAGWALFLRPPRTLAGYEAYYANDPRPPRNGAIKVTFLGTSTLLFEDDSTKLLVDGFISRPPLFHAITRPLRTNTTLVDSVLKRVGADRIDALFTVHSHYDHALDAAYIVRTRGGRLYGSESTKMVGLGGDVAADSIRVIVLGRPDSVGEFRVTAFRARHSKQLRLIRFPGVITHPLRQPAWVGQYREGGPYKAGGSFDLLIQHGNRAILIKGGPVDDAPPAGLRADVVFLGTGTLGKRDRTFQNTYYEQWVCGVGARHVIPIHWDDFFAPLSDSLPVAPWVVDRKPRAGFDYLIKRTKEDSIGFQILQGFGSVLLFSPDGPPAVRPPRPPARCPRRAGG
jgi:L-ascorbate metabolism protein UlaG (beta-lactamase superfamily)